MCLVSVKDEEPYAAPARVKRVARVRRYSSPPRDYSRTHIEEHQSFHAAPPPPPPPPEVFSLPLPSVRSPSIAAPPSARAPTVRPPSTVAPSVRSPSVHSRARSHYVEVDERLDDSASSSSSSREDIRSRTSKATTHTRKSSRSGPGAPQSVYSLHERDREIRRERGYSRPRDEFASYKYVDAPSASNRSIGRSDRRSAYRP
nr:hypothetical protein CFP56_78183 [Quercus suber]